MPISSSQDTTGPMGKGTWDVAVALDIMAAEDPDDPYTFPVAPFRPKSYTEFLDPNGFRGCALRSSASPSSTRQLSAGR